jgi:aminoglycoside phosphotransferase (APT) family kinase protein
MYITEELMDTVTANKIFKAHGFESINLITKLKVGFTNDVYTVDDSYILKICKDVRNEKPFQREVALYEYFGKTLPVPQSVVFDDSKTHYPKMFMIYKKIDGENLYNVWHTIDQSTRESIVNQLCRVLKTIAAVPLEALPEHIGLSPAISWREFIVKKIKKYLSIVEEAKTITTEEAQIVRHYIEKYASCLDEQKVALVYWDAHFDNVLVKDGQLVGLIDFERTEVASIDFMLDVVKRMIEQPKKYMSEYAEQFAHDEDYKDLLVWYEEFYPDLFEFKDLQTRLDLYEIAHNLEDLENWPQVTDLKSRILRIVKTK